MGFKDPRRSAAYVAQRRNQRRIIAREILGERCSECGLKQNIYYTTRDRSVSNMSKVWTASEAKFYAEIERTILLCSKCFWERERELGIRREYPAITHGKSYAILVKKCQCEICRDPATLKRLRSKRLAYERNRYRMKRRLQLGPVV